MKKIIYSILLILGMFLIPNSALAESCTSSITGNKTITVGGTTTLYVKVNTSNPIKGADIDFEVTGNLKLVSASPVGLNKMAQNGNRYILYSNNGVTGNIFAIKVKGTAVGTGTVKVNSLETTIEDETVECSLTNAVITIKEQEKKVVTTTTDDTKKTETPKEEVKKEEKTPVATKYDKALALVERAENTKKKADVIKAKAAVDELEFSEKKYNLMERLLKINIETEVVKETESKNDMTQVSTDVTAGMSWFFLAIILLICLAAETVYMLFKEVKKNEA